MEGMGVTFNLNRVKEGHGKLVNFELRGADTI